MALEYLVEPVNSPALAPRIVATFLRYDNLELAQSSGQGDSHRFNRSGIVVTMDRHDRALDACHDWQKPARAAYAGSLWPDASIDLVPLLGDARWRQVEVEWDRVVRVGLAGQLPETPELRSRIASNPATVRATITPERVELWGFGRPAKEIPPSCDATVAQRLYDARRKHACPTPLASRISNSPAR
jgi:hypothetical protein